MSCIVIVDPIINKVREAIPFFSLLPIPFCASPKPGTGFPSTNVVVFFYHNHLKRDVVDCFVDISGFYFHHF
jgi:hypothetical protein